MAGRESWLFEIYDYRQSEEILSKILKGVRCEYQSLFLRLLNVINHSVIHSPANLEVTNDPKYRNDAHYVHSAFVYTLSYYCGLWPNKS
jgi:hypothetical protein